MIFPWILIAVAAIIAIIAVVALTTRNASYEETKRTGKYPKGHYMGIGMAIGISIGTGIGVALGNIAIGPAIGAGIGVALGAAMEKQHEGELRDLTEEEKKNKKIKISIVLGLLVFSALVALGFYLLYA